MIEFVEVCAGLGGFSHAAEMVNDALGYEYFRCVGFSEVEPFCVGELNRKWPRIPQLGDIHNVADELDRRGIYTNGLFGGIPCQPYSEAGKQLGASDARDLWPATLKIIQAHKPRWVCIENVSGFADDDDGLPRVWDDLENEGYEVGSVEIPACAVGASHERMRTFVMARKEWCRSYHCHAIDRYGDGTEYLCPECFIDQESCGCPLPNRPDLFEYKSIGGKIFARPLADSESIRFDTRPRLCGCDTTGDRGRFSCDCHSETVGVVDNAELTRLERCAKPIHRARRREITIRPTATTDLSLRPGPKGYGTQSGICSRFDELATPAIRGQQHPALMGEPQFEWEPPRLAPKGKEWKQQISALGNAIVPTQLFPVLLAIALSDLETHED